MLVHVLVELFLLGLDGSDELLLKGLLLFGDSNIWSHGLFDIVHPNTGVLRVRVVLIETLLAHEEVSVLAVLVEAYQLDLLKVIAGLLNHLLITIQ